VSYQQETRWNRKELAVALSVVQSFARARLELRGTQRGARVRCYGRLLVPQRQGIEVGQRSIFLGGAIPTELDCSDGAELVIGERTLFNYGASVTARRSVRIGARCMIASLVHIRDDDGRRLDPVVIGDDVWIAHGAIIEPGTHIGDGAVVATMAVVSGHVPPRSLATGNPAQFFPLGGESPAPTLEPPDGPPVPERSAQLPRTAASEVRETIIEWLDDTRHFGAAADMIPDDKTSLRDAGLLDSLGLVQLVLMLEKRFSVTIDRDRVASPNSQSLEAIIDLVTRPCSQRG
jgi:acetyltransferase-like isoleucine patch superfamily enzyme/acyl carrier protein